MNQKYKNDSLGTRMKNYERATGTRLIPRMPTIIRVDGKAFHTWTKKIKNSFDPTNEYGPSERFHRVMTSTAMGLCWGIQNAQIAYHQSDEVSILLVDYKRFESQQWFDGKVQKIVSVAAAMAATYFNHSWQAVFHEEPDPVLFADLALFDARVFQLPKEEVTNYFIWRQQDATRNSIQLIGRKHFSHKEMEHKNTNEVQEMLWREHDCNWNDYKTWKKRGQCIIPNPGTFAQTTPWVVDEDIPVFTQEREYIDKHVYIGEE